MSKKICRCEKCSKERCKDPVTGLLVYGRMVGHNEFLAHGRLTRMKQHHNDTSVTSIWTDADDAPIQIGSQSQNHTTITEFEQELGTTSVQGSAGHRAEGANRPFLAVVSGTIAYNLLTFQSSSRPDQGNAVTIFLQANGLLSITIKGNSLRYHTNGQHVDNADAVGRFNTICGRINQSRFDRVRNLAGKCRFHIKRDLRFIEGPAVIHPMRSDRRNHARDRGS